jgi:F1F0 ATPase subunit 2
MGMNESLGLAAALVAGILLGAMFFGGLWWTVREGLSSKRVARWFLGSLLIRMSVTLAGIYVVSGHHWERFLLCLLGFTMARGLVRLLTRPSGDNQSAPVLEVRHAP